MLMLFCNIYRKRELFSQKARGRGARETTIQRASLWDLFIIKKIDNINYKKEDVV